MGLDNYFDLKKSFVFYGAYHNEWRNKLIHICCVPMIYTTALQFASRVRIGPVSLSDVAAGCYALSFMKMELGAGLMYAPLIYLMHSCATTKLQPYTKECIGIHVVCWLLQFIGHGIFERRAPALLDNPLQAVHAAVFFVWLEVLFALGYKPTLAKTLQELVDEEVRTFQSSTNAKSK
jgi:uncharacterized membrane protein YGL010W